jgi:hypothetical protein
MEGDNSMSSIRIRMKIIGIIALAFAFLLAAPIAGVDEAQADISCTAANTVRADVVLFDTPMFFNRLGAHNPNWMMYALKRDVVAVNPITRVPTGDPPGTALVAGAVALRPDKRPRPLTLRVNAGQCLEVEFTNLLDLVPNPLPDLVPPDFNDNQVASRRASFHAAGMQVISSSIGPAINADGSNVGANASPGGLVTPGGSITQTLFAKHEGAFLISNHGAQFGGEATGGNVGVGAFGMVNVEPAESGHYRSQVTEEELRLALDIGNINEDPLNPGHTPLGQPIINYEALYPNVEPWISEGKANKPVLNMQCIQAIHGSAGAACGGDIVTFHSEINAIIAHRGEAPNYTLGDFPPETYPPFADDDDDFAVNPTVPNRLEPFREFSSIFHDENAAVQAFPGFFDPNQEVIPGIAHTTHGIRDSFMINYASGGIGSEIIANRLGVGPMYDCLGCAYEEFFLTSFTVGDPGMWVDLPANVVLNSPDPNDRATTALYPEDPASVHHTYTGDFIKFRNIHAGPKEQHIFHLHNHQWLFNASDDNANYLDAQGIGPGSSYTYEINFGGSGNRNKTAGDAIFHCHFYPHFAQGMWYLLRVHDVLETGTVLDVTGAADVLDPTEFHTVAFDLQSGLPAAGTRALPDGEILAGTPIPAVVPLPGKPMPPVPGQVVIVTKDSDNDGTPDSSQANVIDRDRNPGFPFWIAGVDCGGPGGLADVTGCGQGIVGQRPPTPLLDMLTDGEASFLAGSGEMVTIADIDSDTVDETVPLWNGAGFATNAGGFDGGLPRHSLDGLKAANAVVADPALDPAFVSAETRLDFHKEVLRAKPVYFPEEGTDLEKVAMATHAIREHPTCTPDGTCDDAIVDTGDNFDIDFVLNGAPPQPSAPFHEPCIDDRGDVLGEVATNHFFSPNAIGATDYEKSISDRDAADPFIYKAANIQVDAVFNKVGYHYPQQRIIALWGDVLPTINKEKAPEPFVMRLNTFNCAKYLHSNLVPKEFELDDYQVRTPTDIIGQHIHLPKWDLTTTDGAANGWNYEDGTLSPGMVAERIEAINEFNDAAALPANPSSLLPVATIPKPDGSGGGLLDLTAGYPTDPDFPTMEFPEWNGARVTIQRWFADPVINRDFVDRGLGIIFTHDHYGPSTHQQIGLYATLLVEPAGSIWKHNETGVALGTDSDGGPTSWQAAIEPGGGAGAVEFEPFREFYLEFSDFQHAYEAGIYVGADQDGRPNGIPPNADTFRHAINPSVHQEAVDGPVVAGADFLRPELPDIVRFPAICPGGVPRPCPEAISADDPGMLVVNYRNEPIGLRVFDPFNFGPDNKLGTQTASEDVNGNGILDPGEDTNLNGMLDINPRRGDLAHALESRDDRAIPQINAQPLPGAAGALAVGATVYPPNESGLATVPTEFPPPLNSPAALDPGDPYTPMMRTRAGDLVRVKIQAGGHEHEHNATVHGLKWTQGNSGHGEERENAGWRNAQNPGISEQFNLIMPVVPGITQTGNSADYAYSVDASQDGWWSGMWGIIRNYNNTQNDLHTLPNDINTRRVRFANDDEFDGVCRVEETGRGRDRVRQIVNLREYDVTAVLANDVLSQTLPLTIPDNLPVEEPAGSGIFFNNNLGGPLATDGGTLVYNPRTATAAFNGPLHDPTAILYVRTEELVPIDANDPGCFDNGDPLTGTLDATLPTCPVRLADFAPVEPLVLRANAGDCIQVTLRNKLLEPARTVAGNDLVIDVNGDLVFIDEGQDLFVDLNLNGIGDQPFCADAGDAVVAGTDPPLCCPVGQTIDPVSGECTPDGGITLTGLPDFAVVEQVAVADVTFDRMPDLGGFNTLLQMVIRNRQAGAPLDEPANSVTSFNNNLVAPSPFVGIHAQLVEYDVTRDDGAAVGRNPAGQSLVEPGSQKLYQWYAGDIAIDGFTLQGKNNINVTLKETLVEYGGSNLIPADKIKQGQKGAIGALVIEPEDAEWPEDDRTGATDLTMLEDVRDRQQGDPLVTRKTRADLTVMSEESGDFEDLVVSIQKGQNHRYGDGHAVENIAGEGGAIPEDSHDAGQKGINYGTEPAWFRFGLPANSAFGNPGLGGQANAWQLYSNALAGENPATPVFTAPVDEAVRLRVLEATGVGRGTTFTVHGHAWQRAPYLQNEEAGDPDEGFLSQTIGFNPIGFYLGGQESVTPYAHFDVVLDNAGGENGVTGDYLFRDQASFGNTDGIWGIMRVE